MNYEKMTTRELLEESLKQLKIIQLDNLIDNVCNAKETYLSNSVRGV